MARAKWSLTMPLLVTECRLRCLPSTYSATAFVPVPDTVYGISMVSLLPKPPELSPCDILYELESDSVSVLTEI